MKYIFNYEMAALVFQWNDTIKVRASIKAMYKNVFNHLRLETYNHRVDAQRNEEKTMLT